MGREVGKRMRERLTAKGRVSDEFKGVRALNEGRALDVDGLTDRRLPHILAGALREQQ